MLTLWTAILKIKRNGELSNSFKTKITLLEIYSKARPNLGSLRVHFSKFCFHWFICFHNKMSLVTFMQVVEWFMQFWAHCVYLKLSWMLIALAILSFTSWCNSGPPLFKYIHEAFFFYLLFLRHGKRNYSYKSLYLYYWCRFDSPPSYVSLAYNFTRFVSSCMVLFLLTCMILLPFSNCILPC